MLGSLGSGNSSMMMWSLPRLLGIVPSLSSLFDGPLLLANVGLLFYSLLRLGTNLRPPSLTISVQLWATRAACFKFHWKLKARTSLTMNVAHSFFILLRSFLALSSRFLNVALVHANQSLRAQQSPRACCCLDTLAPGQLGRTVIREDAMVRPTSSGPI